MAKKESKGFSWKDKKKEEEEVEEEVKVPVPAPVVGKPMTANTIRRKGVANTAPVMAPATELPATANTIKRRGGGLALARKKSKRQ